MEVDRIDAAVRTEVEAMMVLTEKPEVSQTDAALLVEELAEIYSTPTPMGLPEPKKVNNLYLINCVFITMAESLYLYPGRIRVLKGLV